MLTLMPADCQWDRDKLSRPMTFGHTPSAEGFRDAHRSERPRPSSMASPNPADRRPNPAMSVMVTMVTPVPVTVMVTMVSVAMTMLMAMLVSMVMPMMAVPMAVTVMTRERGSWE